MRFSTIYNMIFLIILTSSCGFKINTGSSNNDEEEKEENNLTTEEVETTEENGTFIGTFKADAEFAQSLKAASGDIAGAELLIPGGALSVDTSITLAPSEEQIANGTNLASAGSTGEVLSVGPSISLNTSEAVDLSGNMTLSIPTGASAGLVEEDKFPTIFIVISDSEGKTTKIKILKTDAITIEGNIAKFATRDFGVFQFAYVSSKIDDQLLPKVFDFTGDYRGHRVEVQGGWYSEVYAANGLQMNAEGAVTGFYDGASPTDFQALPGVSLEPVTGQRLFRQIVPTGNPIETSLVHYSAKLSAMALYYIVNDEVEISIFSKDEKKESYPPDTTAIRKADEYLGEFRGEFFKVKSTDPNAWTARDVRVDKIDRGVFKLEKINDKELKVSGKLAKENIEEGKLTLDDQSSFHKYHGAFEGQIKVKGENKPIRALFALDKKSVVFVVCDDADASQCWQDPDAAIAESPAKLMYGLFEM